MLPLISAIAYRGIKVSQEVLVFFGVVEFLIVLALGVLAAQGVVERREIGD